MKNLSLRRIESQSTTDDLARKSQRKGKKMRRSLFQDARLLNVESERENGGEHTNQKKKQINSRTTRIFGRQSQ